MHAIFAVPPLVNSPFLLFRVRRSGLSGRLVSWCGWIKSEGLFGDGFVLDLFIRIVLILGFMRIEDSGIV